MSTTNPSAEPFDLEGLRHARQEHLRRHMERANIGLCVLTNPVSIRYATDYRGCATFQSRIPSQYLLMGVAGPVVLHGGYTDELSTIDRCATAHSITGFDAGLDLSAAAKRFVADVQAALRDCGLGADAPVAIERSTPSGHRALEAAGLILMDAEPMLELARSRKLPAEIIAIRAAVGVAEQAIARMYDALLPGISENELFAILHHTNIANDGDWVDGRMLCSGPRTNPWYQEASGRLIEDGDMVAFDTDMVGPLGYCADISRTWVCGGSPSPTQMDLYKRALEEIHHNTDLLSVGSSFRDISNATFRHPEEYRGNRYACAYHGVGMSDEYPKIPYPQDWHWTGYDGELEDGAVLSVESYVGATGGSEGVKLEQMVQITQSGVVPLSTYPLWDA